MDYLNISPPNLYTLKDLDDYDPEPYYKKWVNPKYIPVSSFDTDKKRKYTWDKFASDYSEIYKASDECLYVIEYKYHDINSQTYIRLNDFRFMHYNVYAPVMLPLSGDFYTFNGIVYDGSTKEEILNFTPPFDHDVIVYPFHHRIYFEKRVNRKKIMKKHINVFKGVHFKNSPINLNVALSLLESLSDPSEIFCRINVINPYTIICNSGVLTKCGKEIISRIEKRGNGSQLISSIKSIKDPLCKKLKYIIEGYLVHQSVEEEGNFFRNTLTPSVIKNLTWSLRQNNDPIMNLIEDKDFKWGLGLEREQIIYIERKIMDGKSIKMLYNRLGSQIDASISKDLEDEILMEDKVPPFFRKIQDMIQDDYYYTVYIPLGDNIVQNLLGKYKPSLTDIDDNTTIDDTSTGYVLEFRTSQFYKKTIGQVVKEIADIQSIYIKNIKKDYPEAFIPETGNEAFIEVDSHDIYNYKSIKNYRTIISGGSESYHINITLPYIGYKYLEFRQQHIYAMLTLQWFENLLVASYGSADPFSIGGDGFFTKASMRLITSKTVGLANLKLSTIDLGYHDNVINSISDREIEQEKMTLTHKMYEDEKFSSSYSQGEIFWNSGTDFRIDRDKEDIWKGKFYGFEFRLMDAIPLNMMDDLLRIIFLICDHSHNLYEKNTYITLPTENDIWAQLTFKILKQGFIAPITVREQVEFLKATRIDFVTPTPKTTWVHHFFTLIVDGLYKTYRDEGFYSRMVAKDSNNKPYKNPPRMTPCLNTMRCNDIIQQLYVDPITMEYRGILKTFYSLIPQDVPISILQLTYKITPIEYRPDVLNLVYYLLYKRKIKIIEEDDSGNILSVQKYRR